MSEHLIFSAVSVHMQGSYIILARTLCSQNSKRLHLLFVDPLRLIKGTSHKLLWGKGQKWVGKGGGTFCLFAQLLQLTGKLPVWSKWGRTLYLGISLFMYDHLFRILREWIFNSWSIWSPCFWFSFTCFLALVWGVSRGERTYNDIKLQRIW